MGIKTLLNCDEEFTNRFDGIRFFVGLEDLDEATHVSAFYVGGEINENIKGADGSTFALASIRDCNGDLYSPNPYFVYLEGAVIRFALKVVESVGFQALLGSSFNCLRHEKNISAGGVKSTRIQPSPDAGVL